MAIMDNITNSQLLTALQVADYLQISRKRVYELPIPVIKLGPKRLRWRLADLRAFLEERTVSP